MAAATQLYGAHSYTEVSVAEIATAAHSSTALVFHYFGTKAQLYAEVVSVAIDALGQAQNVAIANLGPDASKRDRVRASIEVYLDHIATHPTTWAAPLLGGEEPPEAVDVRRRARQAYVAALRGLLHPSPWPRHDFALEGYFGFLDQACLLWVDHGCPADERSHVVEAALGALQGGLGDWGS